MRINSIINEIENLRGSVVRIFGQPTRLADTIDELTVDVCEVLEKLKEFEVYEFEIEEYDEENDDYECRYTDNFDEYLDYLEENRWLEEVAHDNTYNYNANISNHIDYRTRFNNLNGKCYIEVMVHRFGDVRCNYTDACILEMDSMDIFYEIMSECTKYVDIIMDGNEYRIAISPMTETKELYDNNWNYIQELVSADLEGVIEEIKSLQ